MLFHERNPHLFTNTPIRGLIRIQNLQSNRTLLITSNDLASDIQRCRFSLDLGTFDCDSLQSEYEAIGLESFSIDAYYQASDEEDLEMLLNRSTKQLEKQGISLY